MFLIILYHCNIVFVTICFSWANCHLPKRFGWDKTKKSRGIKSGVDWSIEKKNKTDNISQPWNRPSNFPIAAYLFLELYFAGLYLENIDQKANYKKIAEVECTQPLAKGRIMTVVVVSTNPNLFVAWMT